MSFLHKTTAPHILIVPEGWRRISLESDDAALAAVAKQIATGSVAADVPRDKRPLVIEQVRRYLMDAMQDAKATGMLGVTLPVGDYAAGRTMPVSVTDFEYDSGDDREGGLTASMLNAGMLRGGRSSQIVELADGARAVRTLAVDTAPEVDGRVLPARSVTLLFAIPIPARPERFKGVQFTFTVPAAMPDKVDRAYLAIADVMIRSFRFVEPADGGPSALEERIAALLESERLAAQA